MNLPESDVHVWHVPLQRSPAQIAELRATMSDEEIQRADRFYFDQVRNRFTAARGALRDILGQYLGINPAEVAFRYNACGKPSLANPLEDFDLRFNLSHSGDLALCVCARGRELGIDVEAVQEIPSADQIAQRYFDAREYATYRALSGQERTLGFFVRWTMKEAYVKARGGGLSIPLDAFSISSLPDAAGRHRVSSGDPVDDRRWSGVRLLPPAGYVASLVVEGSAWRFVERSWE